MPSFYIPLSGLDADSTALNTIANNLSNMSTTGFKAQTTQFSDLFYQQVGETGSGDEIQAGTGVQVAANTTDFSVGSISSTGISSDAAISGTGFFVLDDGGTQLYTRDGNFQTSSTGTLESSGGQAVMGYAAIKGIIDTSGGLTDITIPTGQVMQPSATTNFSMTQNLDSQSPIGTTATGQVKVFDSLGKAYEATVTYTNLGDNKWSYAVTLPDTLTAAAATAAAAATMSVTAATPKATSVNAATTVAEPATTVPNPVSQATTLNVSTSPTLAPAVVVAPVIPSAVAPVTIVNAGTGITTNTYTFDVNGTVEGNTSLIINGPTVGGAPPLSAVTVTPSVPDESVTAFYNDITTALSNAVPPMIVGGIGVTVTNPSANQLVISGPTATVSVGGASAVNQDVALTTTTFNFASSNGSQAMVGPSTGVPPTNLTIQIGAGAVLSAPTFTAKESVVNYAAALQAAVGAPAISGVTIQALPNADGTAALSITGPSNNMVIGGNMVQNFSGTQYTYTLGSYTDPATKLTTLAGIDSTTSLTITAPNTSDAAPAPVTITLTNPAGESLAAYVADIKNQLAANNVTGVTVTGAKGVLSITGPSSMTVTGPFNQDILGTTIASAVTPTTPTTLTSTVALPAAAITPASSSTNTLSVLAPTTSATASILPAATATVASVSSSTLVANTAVPGTIAYTLTPTGMISTNTDLEITDSSMPPNIATITPPVDMTPSNFATYVNTQLAAAVPAAIVAVATGVDGTPATNTNGSLTIVGVGISITAAGTTAGVVQDVAETTTNYNLVTSNGAQAMIGPSTGVLPVTNETNLAISVGGGAAVSAAPFAASLSLTAYANALQTAVGLPAVSGVTITPHAATGQLSITGPANMTITGNLVQDFSATNLVYNFGATGTVSATTNLKITGPTTAGGIGTTPLPVFSGTPETVTDYANDLTGALGLADIAGVTVSANAATGQLTITGPSTITTSGAIAQDLDLTTTNYNFVTSNGTLATVAPTTTLAIAEGGGAAVSVPAFTTSQSVSAYAANLQSALTSNGITDITVTGTNGVLAITGPLNMAITGKVNQTFLGAESNFNFGSYTDPNTGLTAPATVAPSTILTITGPTTAGGSTTINVAPSNPEGESLAQYVTEVQTALAAAKITGINVSAANGVMSITGPDTATIAGSVNQNMLGTTTNYAFESNSTVDPTTNLVLSGQTATGSTASITAPSVATGETVSQYASALTAALSTAGITNVTVTATNGQLSVVGANLSTTGGVNQDLADTTINYNFGSSATVNPATALTIVGPTVSGTPLTTITVAPPVTAGETVAEYAADLMKALKTAGIDTGPDGVSVTANGGQLSIVGPAATLKTAGIASQDLMATTISYDFGTSAGTVAAVDSKTNLTITGLTAEGATATTVAPTITAGESLPLYVSALTSALTAAGIAGVTVSSTAGGQLSITGANISTSGSVIQDPVASANATGTMIFDSSGNLVSPAASLSGITFDGLSDSAAQMDLTWNLYGASGTGSISQTAGASSTSATNQNGYPSGGYESFAIDSSGVVTATYSNGQTQNVAQLAIATVSNEQGLTDMGSTEYLATAASGLASVGLAGTGGRGTIEGSSLEASNVNISAEFSDLIVAQRAFEANAKAVTTFDSVTQETINMIH